MISSSTATSILASSFVWTTANLNVCQGFITPTQYHPKDVSSHIPPALRYRGSDDGMEELTPKSLSPHAQVVSHEKSSTLSGTSYADARALFDQLDVDGLGQIGIEELHQQTSELFPGSVWNERALCRLMSDIKSSNSELIEFEDFHSWLSRQEQEPVGMNNNSRLVVANEHVIQLEEHMKSASSSPTKVNLSYDSIQDIIDVSRPYYALENEGKVVNDLGETIGFVAEVSPEMPIPHEAGTLGSCEAIRHLAIAGSVAAAMSNPKQAKHYYLALNGSLRQNEVLPASIQQSIDELIPSTPGKPRIFAYSTSVNKREATSEAFLFTGDNDNTIIRINVSYKIIPASIFGRFFPEVETIDKSLLGPWNPEMGNPYADNIDINIDDVKIVDSESITYTASMDPVCPSKCFGHFDRSPCLPVAFLIGHLVDIGGQSVARLCENNGVRASPLVAKDGFLDASSLCQAGTHGLKIEGETGHIGNGAYKSTFNIFSDNNHHDHIAFVEFTFQQTAEENNR